MYFLDKESDKKSQWAHHAYSFLYTYRMFEFLYKIFNDQNYRMEKTKKWLFWKINAFSKFPALKNIRNDQKYGNYSLF